MVLLHFYTDLCVLHSRKTLEKEQNKDEDDSGPHSGDDFLIITKHIQGTYKKRVHLIHLTFSVMKYHPSEQDFFLIYGRLFNCTHQHNIRMTVSHSEA